MSDIGEWPEREALEQMAKWLAKQPHRFVTVEPSIWSTCSPWPKDILSRKDRGSGLYWTVKVGFNHGDEEVSWQMTGRTIAEAWTTARAAMLESVQ